MQYPTNETSVGSRILQSHDDTTGIKMTTASLLFASALLRERFLGRVRSERSLARSEAKRREATINIEKKKEKILSAYRSFL